MAPLLVPPTQKISTGTIFKIADNIAKKKLAPSSLSYKQWQEQIPNQVKQRVFFSSKLFQAEHLSDYKTKLIEALEGRKIKVRDSAVGRKYWESKGMLDQINPSTGKKYGDAEVFQSRSQFVKDMVELARERGFQPTGYSHPDIEDQRSPWRVDLVFDYNLKTAVNTANYNASVGDKDLNQYFIAWEFGRLSQAEVPRDWDERWQDAGDACGWEGASKSQKIALKSSPIWKNLNSINPESPLPPYDWNSHMGHLREVSRSECESLGIVAKGEKIAPPALIDLSKTSPVDISGLDKYTLQQVKAELGDSISIIGGKPFWTA